MPRYAVFLRGINLGRRRVKMAALKQIFEGMGFKSVATLLASGNLMVESAARSVSAMEGRIESQLAVKLGYQVDTFVRSNEEIQSIASLRPFGDQEDSGNHTMHIFFFKEPVDSATRSALLQLQVPTDRLQIIDRQMYWLREGRLSDSQLWTSPAARKIRLPPETLRTAATVRKLAGLMADNAGR